MKKNKFLLYIVMFFALFLVNSKKVNAAKNTYRLCKYQYNLSQESFDHKQDFAKAQILYVNGVARGGAVNSPIIKDNQLFSETEKGLKKYIDYSNCQTGKDCGCPDVKFKAVYNGKVFGNDKTLASTVNVKGVSAAIANINGDLTCHYNSGDYTIYFDKFAQSNEWLDGISIGVLTKDFYINTTNLHFKWLINNFDEERSTFAQLYDYLYNNGSGCPAYAYTTVIHNSSILVAPSVGSASNSVSTQDSFSNTEYKASDKTIVGTLKCDSKIDNDAELNKEKDFINKNYKKNKESLTKDICSTSSDYCSNKIINSWKNVNGEGERIVCGLNSDKIKCDTLRRTCAEAGFNNSNWEKFRVEFSNADFLITSGLFDSADLLNVNLTCNDIFGDKNDPKSLMYIINLIMGWIRIIVPILLIVLGILDFTKVVASQDPDAMKKSVSKFSKRCVIAIIIIFIPYIVSILMGWIDKYIMSTDPNCVINQITYIINNKWR